MNVVVTEVLHVREDAIFFFAGAPEHLDVADANVPLQVQRSEPLCGQERERKRLEHVLRGAGEDLEEGRYRADPIPVLEFDRKGRLTGRDRPGYGIDDERLLGGDGAEAE